MKRKASEDESGADKKQATESSGIKHRFREGLLSRDQIKKYSHEYASSGPYLHAVVSELINDDLLRSVRSEIRDNIHFTPKETDIYKIHQSGDLANLDGLDPSAIQKLPSLLKLRDALYGPDFRQWVSSVSGAGPLSGKKTDMAVNVYVPGCHLLCHDDVIGTRRVSYILYLTDPDHPWKAEWGGALRLYPTDDVAHKDGKTYKLPKAEWTKVIPPAWNQLSFFTVQPGESFHDVEEVYHKQVGGADDDCGRVRMAISGWFHIPQEGESGFELGLEEKMAERSSLKQLQGNADEFDEPQNDWFEPEEDLSSKTGEGEDVELSEDELQFLIKFMTPNYLTPDTVEELNEIFTEESILQLTDFLSEKFSARLKESLEQGSAEKLTWAISRPPHKHRYQYAQHTSTSQQAEDTPLVQILHELLPSLAFRKWLALVTGLTLKRCAVIARRFRKSLDYQLAQGYDGEEPQLEYTLCITPTQGWTAGEETSNGRPSEPNEDDNPGGYELYMAGEDPDDLDSDDDFKASDSVPVPSNVNSATGAGQRRSAKTKKKSLDPAVYQAAADDDDDDGILFSNPAGWNTFSLVLRDKGTLKFVKYVSRAAPGHRLDVTACVEVEDDDDDDDGEEEVGAGAGRV